jgi:hypothetical protein
MSHELNPFVNPVVGGSALSLIADSRHGGSGRLPWSSRIIQTFIEHMYARNMALGECYHLFIERALAPIQEIKEMALLRHLVTPQSL